MHSNLRLLLKALVRLVNEKKKISDQLYTEGSGTKNEWEIIVFCKITREQ